MDPVKQAGDPVPEPSEAAAIPPESAVRYMEARAVVRRHVLWATGLGMIPAPLLDLIGITGAQIKMLKGLSDLYDVPFIEHKVKNILASLVAGLGAVGIGSGLALSMAKLIPGIGHLAGLTGIPVTAGALTHAVGVIFIQHFESGGTFLDFDPESVRAFFRREFEEAKAVVRDLQEKPKGKQ